MRATSRALGALTAALLSIAIPASASARPTCLGKRATIVGNAHGNHIQGTEHADVIVGGGGNDVIQGNGGYDKICGGAGDDEIYGKNEPDKLVGGPGNDYLKDKRGSDLLVGDWADPHGDATGPTGRDVLRGGPGSDYEVGDNYAATDQGSTDGGGADLLAAAPGNDKLIGGPGHDICAGGDGRDGSVLCDYQTGIEFTLSPAF